jgi:hypothetical protein
MLAAVLGLARVSVGTTEGLGIEMDVISGNFTVQLDGVAWFDSGDIFVRNGWQQLSVRAGTLQVLRAATFHGSDALGAFNGTNVTYGQPSPNDDDSPLDVLLATSVRQYGGGGAALVFESTFPNGLRGAQQPGADESRAGLASSFPSFRFHDTAATAAATAEVGRRGWMSYDGWDCREGVAGCVNQGPGSNPHVSFGTWGSLALDAASFPGGLEGSGPLAVFTDDGRRAVALSALEGAMASSSELRLLAPEAPPGAPTPPPTPGGTHAWLPHAGNYCAGSEPAWAANNVSLAACQAKADELNAPCFDYRRGWPPPQPYCQNCRVGTARAGKLTPTGQNYTAYLNAGTTPAPTPASGALPHALAFGLMGTLLSVPPGFRTSVLLSTVARPSPPPAAAAAAAAASTAALGIGSTVRAWGALMQRAHARDVRADAAKDFTNTHLGFDTDNGAYYYYNTEPGKNYEDTLIGVKAYAAAVGVPVRHVQLDSWWYIKGENGGTKDWVSQPAQFPHGLPFLHNATGWPVTAHNRMWAPDVAYSRANGGGYAFHEEKGLSLPLERRFWRDLFRNASAWGLYNYEQDWLYTEFVGLNYTLSNATAASTWLTQMGEEAAAANLTMQFCMAWPRFVLHALSLPAVTQARASADYQPGNEQWRVGTTSLFLDALGLRPTKDSFWSNSSHINATTKGKPEKRREPYVRLQAAVSTLSTGPVFISGPIGSWDAPLIMRACRKDGRLLQPDRAAVAVDASILARAGFSEGGGGVVNAEAGEVWASTSSLRGMAAPYTQLLAVDVTVPLSLVPSDLGYGAADAAPGRLLVFEANASSALRAFDAAHPIAVTAAATKLDFTLHHIVPRLPLSSWALLGEAASKWVPVSAARFSDLADHAASPASPAGFSVTVSGAPGEQVEVWALAPGTDAPQKVTCLLPGDGIVILVMPAATCG